MDQARDDTMMKLEEACAYTVVVLVVVVAVVVVLVVVIYEVDECVTCTVVVGVTVLTHYVSAYLPSRNTMHRLEDLQRVCLCRADYRDSSNAEGSGWC